MEVVIVAKTRMGRGACVGALSGGGQSLRLIAAENYPETNLVYNVGDVWEIDCVYDTACAPPHVENVIVARRWLRRRLTLAQLTSLVSAQMPPVVGPPDRLFGGSVQRTQRGALYVAARSGIPDHSTTFWRPDAALTRIDDSGKRLHYRHPDGSTLTFVGFQEPVAEIPAATLLRVSLAHWWRPEEKPDGELRCYVQLSGWLAELADAPHPVTVSPTTQAVDVAARDPADVLREMFGYAAFRPLQRRVIDNVLSGRDTLAIMPTGGGKSLCYQLPALLRDGLTVVVSPLIALMHDQVAHLQARGIDACYLNSALDYATYSANMQAVRSGSVRLLYVAPETLLRPEILQLLATAQLTCLAVDEAHCISAWGHDFRPEYRQLIDVRRRYPAAVCIALTATASVRVRDDICQQLAIAPDDVFIAPFDRPNLAIEVQPRGDLTMQVIAFARDHHDEAGIIYCNTIRQVETLASALRDAGLSVVRYHGQLDSETRKRNQDAFLTGRVPIVVATIAFGMGIDKPDVRYVLHAELPDCLEQYYQQIGRAGRDGQPALCRLLYDPADAQTHSYRISNGAPDEADGRLARLNQMMEWAALRTCRRHYLLAYFGEVSDAAMCGNCDNCTPATVDLTLPARKLLACVYGSGQQHARFHVIRVLCGSRAQAVIDRGHDRLATFGSGAEWPPRIWHALSEQLVAQGVLTCDRHDVLHLTPLGLALLRGRQPFFGRPVV